MEESEFGMKSRFAKPQFRFVEIDDIDMELVVRCRKAQKLKRKVCVVIGVSDIKNTPIPKFESDHKICAVTASVVWGMDGEKISAAIIKAVTIMDTDDEDTEDVAMEFASDLVDFLDMFESDIGKTMKRYFKQAEKSI